MSEEKVKKKMEVALKPEHEKLLLSSIEELRKAHKHEEPSKPKEHWKPEDLLKEAENCPTCKSNIAQIGSGYIETMKKDRETKPLKCTTCGLGVDQDEEACPLCGGKNAKEK